MNNTLTIYNISVSVEHTPILHNVNLTIKPGTVHVLMGPNGSGKSTLSYALMGHPYYTITQGSILLGSDDITHMSVDKRAQKGLFLSFQQPLEIPGLQVATFLQHAYNACKKEALTFGQFYARLIDVMDLLEIDYAFAHRNLNEGFSGGEKKRLEMLQLLMLQTSIAILDEIDSGLDIDAINIIAKGIAYAREKNPHMSVLLITHYQRILQFINPDQVHIMIDGTIVISGDATLSTFIEKHGYDRYLTQAS